MNKASVDHVHFVQEHSGIVLHCIAREGGNIMSVCSLKHGRQGLIEFMHLNTPYESYISLSLKAAPFFFQTPQ